MSFQDEAVEEQLLGVVVLVFESAQPHLSV